MRKTIIFTSLTMMLGAWIIAGNGWAGEITFQSQNPNFGGNPFNAAAQLNSANAQNGFTAPRAPSSSRASASSGQDFARRLDSAVLSRLTRILAGQIVDDNGDLVVGGVINTGVNTIQVIDGGTITIIQITDLGTGETTTIEVPNL